MRIDKQGVVGTRLGQLKSACVCACVCLCVQRVRRVVADPALTSQDVQDAFEALLTNIPSTSPASPTGAASVAGIARVLSAAAEHVRELYLLLGAGPEQQAAFDAAVKEAMGLPVDELAVARFFLDYEVCVRFDGVG